VMSNNHSPERRIMPAGALPPTLLLALAACGCASAANGRAELHAARAQTPEVRLYRDSFGMAHLYANRESDGFFGLGYAVGEDRLLQVLTWYVAVRGELAKTFGPTTP